MYLPIGQVNQVLTDYISQEVLPKAAGANALFLGVGSGLVLRKLTASIEAKLPILKGLGLVDEQNRIDIEAFNEELTKTLSKTGSVNIMGYLFDTADAESLFRIAQKYAVN